MKALVFTKYGNPENLQLQEIDKPSPKDNEVLIKVHAAAINDWDWGLIRGKPFVTRMIAGVWKPKINIPGVDISGKVEAVGKNIKQFKTGDEVYGDLSESGFGGFAEYVCANENAIIKKPANMSFVEAAAIPHAAMLTTQGLLDIGKIQKGQKLLINGAGGGVGTYAVQIAKLYENEITGVDSGEKLEMMQSMGYDHVIDYKKEDFTKKGQKYDLILDTKTNRPTYKYARVLNPNGKYVTVGGHMGRILQAFLIGQLIKLFSKKKIIILGLKPNKGLDYINKLFDEGKIKSVIDGPYKFEELPKMIQYFGEAKHKGKVIVNINHGQNT